MAYDVIVVGAGSNGSTAAYFLAKKGFKTLLLEAGREPGEKCHGATEFVPEVIFKNRPDLVALMLKAIKKARHLHPGDLGRATYYYYVNKENRVIFKSYIEAPVGSWEHSYGLHNRDFVKALADETVKAGAELRTSTTVTDVIRQGNVIKGVVTEDGEKIGAKLTIAADGRISTIAKKAGLLKKWDLNRSWYHYGEAWKFRSEEEMFEYVDYGRHIFFGSTLTPPYPWQACTLSPRSGGIVTVNAPTSWTSLGVFVNAKKNSKKFYMQNMYKLMEVRRMLRTCKGFPDKPLQQQSTFMPGPPLEKPSMAGLIICGDAGGAGGICGAGHFAARYVIPLLEKGDVSKKALAGFAEARSSRSQLIAESQKKSGDKLATTELSEFAATRIMHWSTGAGFPEQYNCTIDEMVENMRLAATPHVMGAPNPEKCGEFGYVELGSWIIATKISHLMNLYGPFLRDPNVFPIILKWIQRNQQSFDKTKVIDHPF
jgi:flavin-dependent dehydrogenase